MAEDLSNNNSQRDVLSSSTLRRLITDDTAQWARSIYAEKKAISDAINIQRTQNQSKQTIGAIAEFGGQASGDVSVSLAPSISAGASSAPVEFGIGGTGTCNGLQLYRLSGITYLTAAPIAEQMLPDFTAPLGMNLGSSLFTRFVWVEITIDQENGNIIDIKIQTGSNAPEYDETGVKATILIGRISAGGVENFGCGGVIVNICRSWYRSSPPFYSVTMEREG